jgi:hypothetical protein
LPADLYTRQSVLDTWSLLGPCVHTGKDRLHPFIAVFFPLCLVRHGGPLAIVCLGGPSLASDISPLNQLAASGGCSSGSGGCAADHCTQDATCATGSVEAGFTRRRWGRNAEPAVTAVKIAVRL